jgi:toxin ParE1/3/4
MAQLIWTEPALSDLDAIADYIALDNPEAARRVVARVFHHVEQLAEFPESGSIPQEFRDSRYRQIVEPPCRVLYRYDGERVFILYVQRHEQKLTRGPLRRRERKVRASSRSPGFPSPSSPG